MMEREVIKTDNNTMEHLHEAQAVKKGLILEGGAMRGMFTCGVIDVLM